MTDTLQSNNNKQTGTRPKSRSSTNVLRNPSFGSWLGSHQALVTATATDAGVAGRQ